MEWKIRQRRLGRNGAIGNQIDHKALKWVRKYHRGPVLWLSLSRTDGETISIHAGESRIGQREKERRKKGARLLCRLSGPGTATCSISVCRHGYVCWGFEAWMRQHVPPARGQNLRLLIHFAPLCSSI
jgi:hypothetical protein